MRTGSQGNPMANLWCNWDIVRIFDFLGDLFAYLIVLLWRMSLFLPNVSGNKV